MNITMLFSTPMPPREGIGFYCTNLARELVRQGHEVTLITRGKRRTQESAHPDGYRLIEGAFFPVYPFHVHLHGLLLRQTIRKLEPKTDVFHLHSPLVPVIATTKPVISTVHTPMKTDTQALELVGPIAYLAKVQAPVSIQLEHLLLARSNQVTAVARSVANELAAYGLDPARVSVLGNGTDTDFFTPPAQPPAPARPIIFYAGRLAHRKGLFDLIEAFRLVLNSHPQATLKLAGDGSLLSELRKCANREQLGDKVEFMGHLGTRAALRDAYQQAHVYVQPSHYEGLPTSLLEAMSCATPAVATNVSGHPDVIESGRNGLLVPAKAPDQLAQAIAQLLDNPDNAGALGRAGRETVREHFSWPQIAKRYLAIYQAAQS